MCELLIRNGNTSVGRALLEKYRLVNMCVSSRDDQECFCTIFFLPCCCFNKTKTFQKNLYFFLLSPVHASQMPEKQLLSEARQFLPQEVEFSFSVDATTLEAQKVRGHMIPYLFIVFFTKYEISAPFHLYLHLKSFLAAMV